MMANDITPQDEIEIELEKARLAAKRERQIAIGSLLDKATGVLSDVLDNTDPANAIARLRAAEVAVNLYVQQDNGERQDRALLLQQRRLDMEERKLALPGGPLFQQNIVHIGEGQKSQEQIDTEKQMLLARKQAQDAILASYLPSNNEEVEVSDSTIDGDNT